MQDPILNKEKKFDINKIKNDEELSHIKWLENLKIKHIPSDQEPDDEYEKRKREQHLKCQEESIQSMVDAKYKDVRYQHFQILPENKETISKVTQWLKDYKPGKWLVLKGPQGTGKTMLKNIIIRELYIRHRVRSHNTTMYTLFCEYMDSLKNGKNKQLLERLGKTDLLIIDEVGRRKSTEAFNDFMFEVMDRLYINGRSALLITNAESVKDYIDISRLNEVGMLLTLTGKDWRKQND
jgi:DNA replication protein DnaC